MDCCDAEEQLELLLTAKGIDRSVRLGCRYVEQNDIHSPQVTVGESLMFSAQLRLMDVKKHDLTLFVNEVGMPSCPMPAFQPCSAAL